MSKRQKIGVYSGSFNPIHVGHLALANYLCEFEGLDEVWFVVSPLNPFKTPDILLDEKLRVEMVNDAIDGYTKFRTSDVELSFPRPSYTIRTLDHFRTSYPEKDFILLIGSDHWSRFHHWKESKRLISTYEILIYPRKDFPVDIASLPPTVRLVSAPMLEVSSTFIRKALAEGKDVRYFLHPKTWKRLITAQSK